MKNFLIVALLFTLAGSGISTWAGPAAAASGKALYQDKCAICHGDDGKGNGPGGAAFNPGPADFTSPKFWQGDAPGKIMTTVKNGKGGMEPVEASDGEIRAITGYMQKTFRH